MIYKLARSFSNNNYEDLFQVGVIGLLNAYDNFNENYQTKFSTYAYSYIIGEMKKYIRENSGIKISREVSYLNSRIKRLEDLLTQKYKRKPTTKEISMEIGLPEWKIVEALGIRECIKSLDDEICDNVNIIDTISDNYSYTKEIEIKEVMNNLSDEEKKIIGERYLNDKSQQELSNIMGYSQAKISRIEQKTLQKLRKIL